MRTFQRNGHSFSKPDTATTNHEAAECGNWRRSIKARVRCGNPQYNDDDNDNNNNNNNNNNNVISGTFTPISSGNYARRE